MTDLQKCKQDLKRWDIGFEQGCFYGDDGHCVIGYWILIGGLDSCIEFSLDGDYEGWC